MKIVTSNMRMDLGKYASIVLQWFSKNANLDMDHMENARSIIITIRRSVKRQGERMRKIDCDHCKYCLECAELEKSKKEREICLKKERKKYPHL